MSTSVEIPVSNSGQLSEQELRRNLFVDLDARAREIEKQWVGMWMEMADIAITIETNELWREGGYHSYNDWLLRACPKSRSWVYLATGARKELRDISAEDLKQIPLGNAEILKKLPRAKRNGKKLLEGAKTLPPKEFLQQAATDSPESHLESMLTLKIKLTASQSKVISAGFELWRLLHSEQMGDGEILEYLFAEYMEIHKSQWEQLKAGEVADERKE